MRRRGEAEKSDEGILGSGDFVEKIVAEAEERQNRRLTAVSASREVEETIGSMCDEEGVRVSELKGGSRRRQICRMRKRLAQELIARYDIPMAIDAHEIGVTTTTISKIMRRCRS